MAENSSIGLGGESHEVVYESQQHVLTNIVSGGDVVVVVDVQRAVASKMEVDGGE